MSLEVTTPAGLSCIKAFYPVSWYPFMTLLCLTYYPDYRHQDDENLACRGSIALRHAVLTVPTGTSGLRFEVHSTPSRGHSSIQKWYLKANHPVEASRWITALQKSMEIAKRENDAQSRKSGESEAPSLVPSLSVSGTSRSRKIRSTSGVVSTLSTTSSQVDGDSGGEASDRKDGGNAFEDLEHDEHENGDSSDTDSTRQVPPHAHAFELQGNSVVAQVELAAQLFSSMPQSSNSLRAAEVSNALKDTLGSVSAMLSEYVQMVKEREEWYRHGLERERQRQNIWEESLQAVVREGDMLERELRSRFRRRSRAPSVAQEGAGTVKRRTSLLASPPPELVTTPTVTSHPPPLSLSPTAEDLPSPAATISGRSGSTRPSVPIGPAGRPFSLIMGPGTAPAEGSALDDEAGDTDEEDEFFDAIESNTLPNLVITRSLLSPGGVEGVFLSREVYAGYLKLRDRLSISSDDRPPMSLWAVLKNSIGKDLTKISFPVFFNEPTSMLQRMVGAPVMRSIRLLSARLTAHMRLRPLRQRTWNSQNAVGVVCPADVTRPRELIASCVCAVDAAYAEQDPHKRIAFVAAFAMSNYSSTIGRIAKPFNPMLVRTLARYHIWARGANACTASRQSETFEYVRHDKQYRYVSEQVSHHPPISACWAEAPTWRYYGEVDAQNKFMGKSFEIRPTGIAHAELLLPEERAPDYPRAKGPSYKGRVVEHYSWKKVTTNVSGFILGSPTIDHYGDMVVRPASLCSPI